MTRRGSQTYVFKVFSDDVDTLATSSEFKLLQYSCGFWEFPRIDEIRIIETKYIFYSPCRPQDTTKNGYKSEDKTQNMFKSLKFEN